MPTRVVEPFFSAALLACFTRKQDTVGRQLDQSGVPRASSAGLHIRAQQQPVLERLVSIRQGSRRSFVLQVVNQRPDVALLTHHF